MVSEPLLIELVEVLSRPRFTRKYGFTPNDLDQLVALLLRRAVHVPMVGDVRMSRDPDDDMVIETALRGRADVDALDHAGVAVLSVRRFLESLEADEEA